MATPVPPWIELPGDLTANILGRLDAFEILKSVQKVCTTWWKVCKDRPAVWRAITLKYDVVCGLISRRHLSALCRLAVDRSQGQLIELYLYDFSDDELLTYIVDRSSKLRSMRVESCSQMKVKCVIEAVKKLPLLEELHLTRMPLLKPGDIEIIGVSCPLLKSFSMNEPMFDSHYYDGELIEFYKYNEHAVAIAKAMPNLRRLQLVRHWMRNKGLVAILDGCPHLQSLDLWECYLLHIRGGLDKRCSEQIKDLRRPRRRNTSDLVVDCWCDSEEDFWWDPEFL